jgi:glycosyltransferase involved in cell wall biosynthesis
MSKPLVSILCPAYNHELYIAEAIESFLMQKTDFDFEIIIHDDASTDKTAEIVKFYENKYPEKFNNIYQNENQFSKDTMSVSRILFNAAKGKYIALCEGDDYWTDPLKLQKQVDILENNNGISIVCGNCLKRENDIFSEYSFPFNNFNNLTRRNQISKFLASEKWIPVLNFVFRNNSLIFKNIISKPDNFPGDFQILFNCLKIGKFYYLDDILGVYRIHDASFSRVQMTQNVSELKLAIFKYKLKLTLKNLLFKTAINLIRKDNYKGIKKFIKDKIK